MVAKENESESTRGEKRKEKEGNHFYWLKGQLNILNFILNYY